MVPFRVPQNRPLIVVEAARAKRPGYDPAVVTTDPSSRPLEDLVERLRLRVAQRRAEGVYPEGLERDLDAHFTRLSAHLPKRYDPTVLQAKLLMLNSQPGFTPDRITSESGLPGGSAFHGLVAKLVSRQVGGILEQLQEFADATRSVVNEIATAIQHPHGHGHSELLGQIEALHDRLVAYERTPEDAGVAVRELNRRIENLAAQEAKRQFKPWFSNERFEDVFRGSAEEIRSRYVDLAEQFVGFSPVVDLGCGRGEFLDLLVSRGVDAIGVEVDPRLVESLHAKGLKCEHADAIAWLRRAEHGSLAGITMIQVIEHLTPQEVVDFVVLARKKLRTGGKVIVETLNPQSLYIYARAFYADPTHDNPIHPAYLTFLFEEAGFSEVAIDWRSPPAGDEILGYLDVDLEFAEEVNANFSRLNALLFGPQDYALIATR